MRFASTKCTLLLTAVHMITAAHVGNSMLVISLVCLLNENN